MATHCEPWCFFLIIIVEDVRGFSKSVFSQIVMGLSVQVAALAVL